MMHAIPTRIAGATVLRQPPQQRSDGCTVKVRSAFFERDAALSYEETIRAEFAFLSEPSFSQRQILRSLRCLDGETYVCLVDIRLGSTTFGHWQSFYLNDNDDRLLSIPSGVACGWQIMSDEAEVELRASRQWLPADWQVLRWNDKELNITWPEFPTKLQKHRRRSRCLADFADRQLPKYLRVKKSLLGPKASPSPNDSPAPGTLSLASQPTISNSPATSQKKFWSQPPKTASEKQTILVIGSSGQLGRDLCRHLRCLGQVVGACRKPDHSSVLPVPVYVDISRPATLRQAIRQVRPNLIVNAAALTDIDLAERQPRLAQLINATAPAILVEEALKIDASLVHFCSSQVFDGSGERPWRETDSPRPQNQFARTKLVGTQAIMASKVPHLILRTGWLYASQGDNFVRRLIDSLSYRDSLDLSDDHFGNPTSTQWLASTLAKILTSAKQSPQTWFAQHGGLYHASTLGAASKLDVGDQVLATCRQLSMPVVLRSFTGHPLTRVPSQAKVPLNSRLDPTRLAMHFGLEIPRWQQDLKEQIHQMLAIHHSNLGGVA